MTKRTRGILVTVAAAALLAPAAHAGGRPDSAEWSGLVSPGSAEWSGLVSPRSAEWSGLTGPQSAEWSGLRAPRAKRHGTGF
jgi:hypothetical protein